MKHIVGFSGGIDSQKALLWVRERYDPKDIIATNSTVGGWEKEETIQFIADYSRLVFPVTVIDAIIADMWETPGWAERRGFDGNAPLSFELMCSIKGRPPSRKTQFCTFKLKLVPQRRWILQTFGPGGPFEGEEFCRYTGVRRDESESRKDTQFESYDRFFDCPLYAPNFDLTKQQCFDAVLAAGEPINPLYAKGFGRVGCAPCINSGKEDIVNWNERFPGYIETKVGGFEQRTGRTFFAPVVPGLHTNTVGQVIEWAHTSHGGRQQLFPILHEREACESKYGLCE